MIARRQVPPSEPCTYFWATSARALDGIIRNDNRGSESLFLIAAEAAEKACYAYALFHSPTYRRRYAAGLRTGFPRVLQPRDAELAAALSAHGRQLVELHTQRPPGDVAGRGAQRLLVTVAPRFPRFEGGQIWIRDDFSVAAAEEEVWQFHVGAHQVARKWLADRRGRLLTQTDLDWYEVMLDAIRQTRAAMTIIDETIERHGGFPAAFR